MVNFGYSNTISSEIFQNFQSILKRINIAYQVLSIELTRRVIDVVSAGEKVDSLTYELKNIDGSDERYEA